MTASEKVYALLKVEGPKSVKELQEKNGYTNRAKFLKDVINPLIEAGAIYRDGNLKSPTSVIKLKSKRKE